MPPTILLKLALVALLALTGSPGIARELTGAGASFVFPVLSQWSAEYAALGKGRINYQSIGSGGGIAQAKAGTVDFGSTDAPLASDVLARHGLAQFPSVIGGVVPVVNLEGIAAGRLRLTGELLAAIYLGRITRWDDPAIRAINPDLSLPALGIRVVYRSDGSGTTFNFVHYLGQISPDWAETVGPAATSVRWPIGVGGRGNEGVAAYVKQLDGALGYVELSYALSNRLPHAALRNAAGYWVQPSLASFRAAAASADWGAAPDFQLLITHAPGKDAWPIAATNFILMPIAPRDPDATAAALRFFDWVYTHGDAPAERLGFVPLPDPLVARIRAYWQQRFPHWSPAVSVASLPIRPESHP